MGVWANRTGPAYNTIAIYARTWFGGVRNLRRLLNQSHASTKTWERDSAIEAYRCFYEKHGLTPSQVRRRGSAPGGQVDEEVFREAGRLVSAVSKYASGAAAVQRLLNIEPSRSKRWSREAIIREIGSVIAEWNLSPSQLLYDHRRGVRVLAELQCRELSQLIDAAGREFGGVKPVLTILGFAKPSRPRQKRGRT